MNRRLVNCSLLNRNRLKNGRENRIRKTTTLEATNIEQRVIAEHVETVSILKGKMAVPRRNQMTSAVGRRKMLIEVIGPLDKKKTGTEALI